MLDPGAENVENENMKSPLLSRLLLFGFIWIGLFAGAYLLLDSLGVWSSLPVPLTHGLDMATGAILLLALVGHLLLATGSLPAVGRPRS
jgi:hypothetical protein